MKNLILLTAVLFNVGTPRPALAHGEDRPGPHGGFIRMPGAFHTEVVPFKDGFNVFLLDIEFRNPTVAQSSVVGIIEADGKSATLACTPQADHFFCRAPNAASMANGKLLLTVKRKAESVGKAIYSLPFPRP